MRIVNLETFRSMPEGTIFSKYEPCCFEGLMIKRETISVDFFYTNLICEFDYSDTGDFVTSCSNMEQGNSVPICLDISGRDGCFEDNQLFAIYEKEDIKTLIQTLNDSLEALEKER